MYYGSNSKCGERLQDNHCSKMLNQAVLPLLATCALPPHCPPPPPRCAVVMFSSFGERYLSTALFDALKKEAEEQAFEPWVSGMH